MRKKKKKSKSGQRETLTYRLKHKLPRGEAKPASRVLPNCAPPDASSQVQGGLEKQAKSPSGGEDDAWTQWVAQHDKEVTRHVTPKAHKQEVPAVMSHVPEVARLRHELSMRDRALDASRVALAAQEQAWEQRLFAATQETKTARAEAEAWKAKWAQKEEEYTSLQTQLCAAWEARNEVAEAFSAHQKREPVPVLSLLSQWGLTDAQQIQLVERLSAQQVHALLGLVTTQEEDFLPWLEQHVGWSCGHAVCDAELGMVSSRQLFRATEPAGCDLCGGSTNRRWIRRMVRVCKEHRCYRLVVVGGSPDTHAELRLEMPASMLHRIVPGKEKRTRQQAQDDLAHADLVIVWGSTILPHKLSELYTKNRSSGGAHVLVVQRRGIASLAQDVIAHFSTA
jgi:hypothetical protein